MKAANSLTRVARCIGYLEARIDKGGAGSLTDRLTDNVQDIMASLLKRGKWTPSHEHICKQTYDKYRWN
jgi:hypothetical protein